MRRIFVGLTVLFVFSAMSVAETVKLNDFAEDIKITIEEASPVRTAVKFEIGSFEKNQVDIHGENYFDIAIKGEGIFQEKGAPALPQICRSIVIPDDAHVRLNVLDISFQDFESTPVAPSKGHIKRNIDPQTVPYTFGEIYNADAWYPPQQAAIREPHILRDLRGIVIEINPFQYNPVTKTLRVYTSITVEVVTDGPGLTNVLTRNKPFDSVEPSFEQLYGNHFINYNQGTLLYTPVPEAGDMLIITYDNYHDQTLDLVDWKRQKGIKTTLVNISDIGNNTTSIANFIQAFYDSTDLAWVILVGDAYHIATPYASGGASDPSYAKVAGSDNYPDIFIGRFSAENTGHVSTQVERTINYEMTPQAGASWYHKATGIASNLGPGHYGEYDNQHMDNIRTDLLNYNFTLVDQIYDPSANVTMVANALNAGRSFLNYCGHGSTTGWGSSGFSNINVNNLVNDNQMPFIFSVACINGDFDGATCFGEAWLRATNNTNGNPTGAMATYMSSINQDWNPPMYAQDEATDLLVAESKLTFGGICYNGACYMIDVNGAVGVEHYDTWHIFGDPSIMLTTDTPTTMSVAHDPSVIFTATQFAVTVSGIEGALCALYHNGILYGSAYTDQNGDATINIDPQLPVGETLTLTVTSYNKMPYFGSVTAIAPQGPYVVYDTHTVNDQLGNNNGMVDFGETISLGMQLENVGPDTAVNVSATISTGDRHVNITDSTEFFGAIPGDFGNINMPDAFEFDVSPDIPDGHSILFHLEITGTALDIWEGNFSIQAHAPIIEFAAAAINDASGGNGNGILEAGETANMVLTINNQGSGYAYSVTGVLSESDDYVIITDANASFGDLDPDETADNGGDVFVITADPDFPQGHTIVFTLDITADGGYTSTLPFELRTAESFEYSDGGYVGEGVWQWGEPTYGPPGAYFGTNVWGTILTGPYPNGTDDDLISPSVFIHSAEATLEFYHWYDIENYYDGGNVQISTNDGASWSILIPYGGYPHSGIYSLGEPGYTNVSGGWVQARFALSDYVGENVIFKWRFGSDNYVYAPGWYIDDVAVINNLPLPPPDLSYNPSSFEVNGNAGEIATRNLTLTNNGQGPLYYTLTSQTDPRLYIGTTGFDLTGMTAAPRPHPISYHPPSDKPLAEPEPCYPPVIANSGGPDAFGYSWIDSNEPGGLNFSWIDITSIGTQITGLGDDTNVGPFNIGFNFDFYGLTFSSFRFSTNGFISFTSSLSAYSNDSIPSGEQPYNLVAPFWDDLVFTSSGNAYYYTNNTDSLVVSWANVPHYSSGGPYTFQIILQANGKITFQYLDMNAPLNSATIGIQNGDGSIGLEVVFNADYMENNLAIRMSTLTDWLSTDPVAGTVPAQDSEIATVTFDASELDEGTYTGSLLLDSNDPANPNVTIPVTFLVGQPAYPDISLSPSSITDTLVEGQQSEWDVIISNSGDADLQVSFETSQSWLQLDDDSYLIIPAASDTLTVTINAADLSAGEYQGSIDFSCNDDDQPNGTIPVSLFVLPEYFCEYMPGDVNGDNQVIGSDITYAVNYFRGNGNCPPDSCFNEQSQTWLYVAADANGDCSFIGSDVTYLVSYFRGATPPPQYCPDLPPSNPLLGTIKPAAVNKSILKK